MMVIDHGKPGGAEGGGAPVRGPVPGSGGLVCAGQASAAISQLFNALQGIVR